MKVFGDDKLAFKGESVLFECQAAGWFPKPTLQWQVNDKEVSALPSDMFIIIIVILRTEQHFVFFSFSKLRV